VWIEASPLCVYHKVMVQGCQNTSSLLTVNNMC
jgi:hypothetical protein